MSAPAGHDISAERAIESPADTLHGAPARVETHAGISVLLHNGGGGTRISRARTGEVDAVVRAAWDAVRRLLIAVPAPHRCR